MKNSEECLGFSFIPKTQTRLGFSFIPKTQTRLGFSFIPKTQTPFTLLHPPPLSSSPSIMSGAFP